MQYSGLDPKVQCETIPVGLVEGVEMNLGLDKSIKLSVKTALHAHGPSQHGWGFTTTVSFIVQSRIIHLTDIPQGAYTTFTTMRVVVNESGWTSFPQMTWVMHIIVFRVCEPECTLFLLQCSRACEFDNLPVITLKPGVLSRGFTSVSH